MINTKLQTKEILMTSNTLEFLVRYKISIAKRLLQKGIKVTFGAPFCKDKKLYELLEEIKINVFKLCKKRRGLKFIFNSLIMYKNFLANNKDGLVISHTVYMNLIAIFAFQLFNFSNNKLFVFVSGFGPSRIRNSLRYRILGRIYLSILRFYSVNKNIFIFVLNQDDKNLVQDFIPSRNIILLREAGLTNSELKSKYPDKDILQKRIKIGFLGRFLLEKGICEYIELLKLSRKIGLDFDFYLAGTADSDNSSSLRVEQLSDLELEGVTIEINPDYKEFFKKIDIIIYPSFREGHPMYLFRSMGYGVVPIVYNYPGNTVDIINNYNGLVSEPSTVTGLLSKVILLNENRKLLAFLSKNAYEYSRNFSQDKLDKNFIDLICSNFNV